LLRRFEAEERCELRDVQDRRRDAVDDERGDDRAARGDPALVAVRLSDVDRVELDTSLAKELLGGATRRSGRLPEEDGALAHAAHAIWLSGRSWTFRRDVEPAVADAERSGAAGWRPRHGGDRAAPRIVEARPPRIRFIAGAVPFPSPPLAGAGFVLRPLAENDYAAIDASREHPQPAPWVNPLAEPDGAKLVRLLERQRRAGKLLYLVIAADDGGYLGEILLFVRAPEAAEAGTGEIAYVVAPAARGRGIASEAVTLLSAWAFARLGLARLQLSIRPDNVASRRVAEKAGYRYEGTLRSVKLIRGVRVDAALYSLLPGDGPQVPSYLNEMPSRTR
jgi:RimJ/RimL family protein N-acetyltransferase